jgi:hypothetical protein
MGPEELLDSLNKHGIEPLDNQSVANSMNSAEFTALMGAHEAGGVCSEMQNKMPETNINPEVQSVANFSLSNDGPMPS